MIAVLSIYRFPDVHPWALPTAIVLFVVAALSDALDGYLARKWNAISVFGRIMDPTADKILVLGAYVMLAGPSFHSFDDGQVSRVLPWMAIVILSRELLVTSIRGTLESRGVDFSASISGKLKMAAQSVGAPLIMIVLLVDAQEFRWVNTIAAWTVTLVTALSMVPYVTRARTAFRAQTP